MAADLPVKAPPPPPVVYAPVYNWSGIYGGVGGGYAWGSGLTDMSVSGVFIQRAAPNLDGGIWGGHVGANYQMGSWVVGAEAQWLSGRKGSELVPAFPPPSTFLVNGTVDVSSFGVFKGRLGYAWDRWLPYVTGGYAMGKITSTFRDFNFFGGVNTVSDKRTHDGWALGGGLEYAILDYLIVGVEYLHIDLRDKMHSGFNNFNAAVEPRNHLVDAHVDTVMARLSLKWPPR
jgi:outer membrane immunogenic protein